MRRDIIGSALAVSVSAAAVAMAFAALWIALGAKADASAALVNSEAVKASHKAEIKRQARPCEPIPYKPGGFSFKIETKGEQ